jgi:DNA polymerase-3 subunit epsilon
MASLQKRLPLFAVVDIETTGGYAASHAITEIAVRIHNGEQEVQRYHTMLNPGVPIPRFITSLTGITNEMVAHAPRFEEVAAELYDLLHDKVFVAHNVNFDYSFIRHYFKSCGYTFDPPRLCTVRLSRKVFPGLKSYSLGNICAYLNISLHDRHRASGDVDATVTLWERIVQHDTSGVVEQFLKRGSKESILPPDLLKQDMDQLPSAAGVYYFHNNTGKVIYIGKAKNIKRRVNSHFSNHSAQKQKQDFMRHVKRISFTETGNELFARILELTEIKEKWPEFNRAQKGYTPRYGLFSYTDQRGYIRLAVKRIHSFQQPLYYFSSVGEGLEFLRTQAEAYKLCFRLCGIETGAGLCNATATHTCKGACAQKENPLPYNKRVNRLLHALQKENHVFTTHGRHEEEVGVVLIEQGNFWGYGYVNKTEFVSDREWLLQQIPRARWFPGIEQMIYQAM